MARILTTLAMLICLHPSIVRAAETAKKVTVTGRAVGETTAAEEEAKIDALREAVRRVCGSFINAQSETSNFTLVRDRVLEQPVGFARVVRIVKGPEILEGITQVQLEAEVFPAKFEKRWAEFAHIKERVGNPRCVIVILEDDDPDDLKPARTNGVVQSEVENFFLQKNVQLMDKGVTDDVRIRDLTLAAESGDISKAAAAGAAFKADVVVLGQAEVNSGSTIRLAGQLVKKWGATMTMRAVQTDSGAILVSKTYQPKKALTSTGGRKEALIRIAKDNADDILADIGEAWRKQATVGKTLQVTFEPCSRKQFKAIQAEMIKMKGVNGGKVGFQLRELVNRVASVDVNWKYDLNQLADRIEELKVALNGESLEFEVAEQSAARLTIRITTTSPPTPTSAPEPPTEPALAPDAAP
jgi:hypothetical protein